MPARRSLAESSDYEDMVGAEVAAVARTSMEHALVVDVPALEEYAGIMEAYGEALRDILQGHATPMEAMDELQHSAQ
jgi:ABC-type glycerol-3-phosphate transport system substrate-binding protein